MTAMLTSVNGTTYLNLAHRNLREGFFPLLSLADYRGFDARVQRIRDEPRRACDLLITHQAAFIVFSKDIVASIGVLYSFMDFQDATMLPNRASLHLALPVAFSEIALTSLLLIAEAECSPDLLQRFADSLHGLYLESNVANFNELLEWLRRPHSNLDFNMGLNNELCSEVYKLLPAHAPAVVVVAYRPPWVKPLEVRKERTTHGSLWVRRNLLDFR